MPDRERLCNLHSSFTPAFVQRTAAHLPPVEGETMTTQINPTAPLPVMLGDGLIPLDQDGRYVPNHLDANGTVHWFSVVDVSYEQDYSDRSHELRYFRAARAADGRLIHDSHSVMPVDNPSMSPFPIPQLQMMLEDGELEEARELAYHTARSHGLPFPQPAELPDLRIREVYGLDDEMDTQSLTSTVVEPDPAVEQFRERFSTSPHRLLEPLDPTINYSFKVMASDPWTLELNADKWWLEANGQIGHDSQALNTYSLESYEWEREIEREVAAMDREALEHIYQEDGLEAAMRKAEAMAVANLELDPNRQDGRLFREGPPDRFTTLREAELAGLDALAVEETWRDISNDETEELPAAAPEPGTWKELLDQHEEDEPEPKRNYWQMHYRPVETPNGEHLGTALFVTEFPQLPPDFDYYVEENGMDDSIYPTEARTLEMAHFANDEDAHKFEAEFRGYLVPGLLDGPGLAPEVAKLEGLPGSWEKMDYGEIVDYMSGKRTVMRERSEWHLHNPHAERDAQMRFENTLHDIDF